MRWCLTDLSSYCSFVASQRNFTESFVCLCDAAGLHVFPTFVLYELTILLVLTLSLVIMKVRSSSCCFCFIFFVRLQFLLHLIPCFLPVYDGRTGAVRDLASRLSPHTVDRLGRPRSGQRVLLCSGQPCAPSWHHLQRGQ